jgi:hypothetical protein
MPIVKRRLNVVQDFETEITQEQYDLFQQSPDEFWDLFYNELQQNEDLFDEKVLDEWTEVEE